MSQEVRVDPETQVASMIPEYPANAVSVHAAAVSVGKQEVAGDVVSVVSQVAADCRDDGAAQGDDAILSGFGFVTDLQAAALYIEVVDSEIDQLADSDHRVQ